MTGWLCQQKWEPTSFLSLCVPSSLCSGKCFFHQWCLLGREGGLMCLLFLWLCFLSKGPWISIMDFFFFPLNHQALGGCDLPSYHPPSGNGAHTRLPSLVLWTFRPPLLFPLHLSLRFLSGISTLRVESSFWRWSSSVLLPPLFSGQVSADFRCLFPPCG